MKTRGPNKFKNLSKSEIQKHSKAGEYGPVPDPTGWFNKQGVRYVEELSLDFLTGFVHNANWDNRDFFDVDGWLVLMNDRRVQLDDEAGYLPTDSLRR